MRTEVLCQVDIFRDLDDPTLERLAQEFEDLHVPAQHPIFQEGTPVNAFYVVSSGRVSVYRDEVGKPVQLLTRVEPGEFFGEFALFSLSDNTISARATVDSHILKIEKQTLLDFLEARPAITLRLQMAAAKRHTMNAAAALELGQRSEVRIRIKRPVTLELEDGSSRSVVLDNLSPGGLSLQGAPEHWREGDDVDFDLRFGSDLLYCDGRVAWMQGDLMGFAFNDTSDEHDARVQRSLRRLLATTRP